MKLITRLLKLLHSFSHLIRSRKIKTVPQSDALSPSRIKVSPGIHNCAPNALAKVMPSLSSDGIIKGFFECCDKWPYGGVTNKEFNITLRHLGIFNQFEYDDNKKIKVLNFLSRKDTFIILLYGHFTVIKAGKVDDNHTVRYHDQVYCSWKLINKSKKEQKIISSLFHKDKN